MANVSVLWASSRPDGNTFKSVEALIRNRTASIVNLADKNIAPYDYDYRNQGDDFLSVVKVMQASDTIVFCTPVYWYAMCSQMKVFFDRLSDLVRIKKDIGRSLAGKHVYMMANGTDKNWPEGFEVPFQKTSEYFDMHYQKGHYLHTQKDEMLEKKTWAEIDAFSRLIFS